MNWRRNVFLGAALSLTLLLPGLALAAEGDGVPSPYAGLKNPQPWGQGVEQGKNMYRQSCLGCHGLQGNNVPQADFSAPTFAPALEARPDYYFWVLSEGKMKAGMPPFKSSLSEEQRWQVLDYLRSLSIPTPKPTPLTTPPTAPNPALTTTPIPQKVTSLALSLPQKPRSGEPLQLQAHLQDNQGQPLAQATVRFFMKADFFIQGDLEIGETLTDKDGVAVLDYNPQVAGPSQIIARFVGTEGYPPSEAKAEFTLGGEGVSYHPQIGIPIPSLGPELLGLAPASAAISDLLPFRLPVLGSWLLVLLLGGIWSTYLLVVYQLLQLSRAAQGGRMSPMAQRERIPLPLIAMLVVLSLATLLISIVVSGPAVHLHLAP